MESKNIYSLKDLPNNRIWHHFFEICQKQHNSGKEEEIRKYIAESVKNNSNLKLKYWNDNPSTPGEKNIIIYKPASAGFENKKTIVLQAHLDMVCVPNENIFPLQLILYKENGTDWLKAGSLEEDQGTSLGADNGIGVATALSILEDDNLKCGAIEVLFTVEEETGMGGITEFDPSLLEGRFFINLDSEELDTIIYGCAGGINTILKTKLSKTQLQENSTFISISIEGLRGGHSGLCIDKGRENAIQILSRILNDLINTHNFNINLLNIQGGIKFNSIPETSSAIIAFPSNQEKEFLSILQKTVDAYLEDLLKTEKNIKIKFNILQDNYPNVFDYESTRKMINLLLTIPHGVLRMNPNRLNIVETSTNLGILRTIDDEIEIMLSHRSSSEKSLNWVKSIHKAIAEAFKAEIIHENFYPAWIPDENSYLLNTARKVYETKFNGKYTSNVIHAGLECGYISKKYSELGEKIEAISIGPTIIDPHSRKERVDVKSVEIFYNCLIELIKVL